MVYKLGFKGQVMVTKNDIVTMKIFICSLYTLVHTEFYFIYLQLYLLLQSVSVPGALHGMLSDYYKT